MCQCQYDDVGWGLVTWYESEPWGDTYVDCPKGIEPCHCWRGRLRFAQQVIVGFFIKVRYRIEICFAPEEKNDIPF